MKMDESLALLAKLPTTQATCAVGLVLAVFYVVISIVAALAGHEVGEHTLDIIGLFIAGMMGIGGMTFAAKRFSDIGLAQAKAGAAPPVTINAPTQQTNVQQAAPVPGGPVG